MNKKSIFYVIAFVAIFIASFGLVLNKYTPKVEYVDRDSLIRDSIYIVNDSLENTIVYIETTHEKISNDIMSNTDSVNM